MNLSYLITTPRTLQKGIQGVGTALLQAVENDACRTHTNQELELYAEVTAASFYKKHQYEDWGERYGCIHMKKVVNPTNPQFRSSI